MQSPQNSTETQSVNDVTDTVLANLRDQHDWGDLVLHADKARPLITGLPPRRLYIHPDDQVAALARQELTGASLFADPEVEWVLPVHITEKWSMARMAAVFDSIETKESKLRNKRVVLATLHNDSTVVYYLVHEGMVKPRQN